MQTDSVLPDSYVFSPVLRQKSQTWSPDIDIHAVILNLALRGSGSDGGDTQVSSIQVLLSPLAVVRLVVSLQNRLLVKLLKERRQKGWATVTEHKTNQYVRKLKM